MKRTLLLFLLLSCTAISPERDLAEFLHARSAGPLESTIWEHKTGEDYDKYLLFRGGEMSLFYGLTEGDELQRWSEFFSAPYYYDGGALITYLSYPEWGERVHTNEVEIIESNGYTISAGGEEYTYYSPYTEDIEGQWTLIIAEPAPWN